MNLLQQSAQQAITTQAKKRDAKEAKLKEALRQLADELESATTANMLLEEKLKSLTHTQQVSDKTDRLEAENRGLIEKLQELNEQLAATKIDNQSDLNHAKNGHDLISKAFGTSQELEKAIEERV